MLHEWIVCLLVGFSGITYLLCLDQLWSSRRPAWVAAHTRVRLALMLPYVVTFGALEEGIARGIPMLLLHNKIVLLPVLLALNFAFMAAHRDRDIYGTKIWVICRFFGGLLFSVPALFGSIYGCALLHVLYNMGVLATRIYKNQPWLRDRVIIWAPRRPIELLLLPTAVPATAYRRIFTNMESIRP